MICNIEHSEYFTPVAFGVSLLFTLVYILKNGVGNTIRNFLSNKWVRWFYSALLVVSFLFGAATATRDWNDKWYDERNPINIEPEFLKSFINMFVDGTHLLFRIGIYSGIMMFLTAFFPVTIPLVILAQPYLQKISSAGHSHR